MTKATKRTIGVICLLWLGTLLLLFANYKTKVYQTKAGKAHDFNRGRCQPPAVYGSNLRRLCLSQRDIFGYRSK